MSKQVMMNVPASVKDQIVFIEGMIREVQTDSYTAEEYMSERDFKEIQQRTLYLLSSIKATLEGFSKKRSFVSKLKDLFR